MTTYNPTNLNGSPMPLLMGYTQPSPIMEAASMPEVYYDPVTQTTMVEMRTVGTRSLKYTGRTRSSGGTITYSDPKNEIDDSKQV